MQSNLTDPMCKQIVSLMNGTLRYNPIHHHNPSTNPPIIQPSSNSDDRTLLRSVSRAWDCCCACAANSPAIFCASSSSCTRWRYDAIANHAEKQTRTVSLQDE